VPYLSALEVCSRRGAIQIHVYLHLYLYLRSSKGGSGGSGTSSPPVITFYQGPGGVL